MLPFERPGPFANNPKKKKKSFIYTQTRRRAYKPDKRPGPKDYCDIKTNRKSLYLSTTTTLNNRREIISNRSGVFVRLNLGKQTISAANGGWCHRKTLFDRESTITTSDRNHLADIDRKKNKKKNKKQDQEDVKTTSMTRWTYCNNSLLVYEATAFLSTPTP